MWRFRRALLAAAEPAPGHDLILCHDDIPAPAALALARRLEIPLAVDMVEIHLLHERTGDAFRRIPRPVVAMLNRQIASALGTATTVFTVSESLAETLMPVCNARPVVVRNARPRPDDRHVSRQLRDDLGLSDSARIILNIGSVWDGMELETLASDLAQRPDRHLVLLGQVDERTLERLQKRTPSGVVRIAPTQSWERVPEYAAGADIGIVPWGPHGPGNLRVALPNRVFDYLAAGLPIVAHPLPELERLVSRFRCGVTTDNRLADAIETVLSDPQPYVSGARRAAREICAEKEMATLEATLAPFANIGLVCRKDIRNHARLSRIVETLVRAGKRVTVYGRYPPPLDLGQVSWRPVSI